MIKKWLHIGNMISGGEILVFAVLVIYIFSLRSQLSTLRKTLCVKELTTVNVCYYCTPPEITLNWSDGSQQRTTGVIKP